MSGHSKFANIKHKKEKNDAKKGKIFTVIGREIAVAVKEGGPDPDNNSRLRDVIAKAKANNMPNDTIERGIKKAAGAGDGVEYETITYEGYGPNGVAVIVECLTDNKNRTAGDIRHFFDKFGGNMGTSGCVSFMFSDVGTVVMENNGADEDKIMEDCFEAGADDFNVDDDVIEISCDPNQVSSVREALEGMGYKVLSAESEKVPSNYTTIEDEDAIKKMGLLLEHLEDDDDVQNVYHNWENMPVEEEE